MRVARRRGRLQMRLEPVEVSLLRTLFDELAGLLDGRDGDGADDVRARLSPPAFRDDEAADQEFRRLTAASLRGERDERLDACRADLRGGGLVDLTEEDAAQRWIRVLNDLRLTFGTRLGVGEDDGYELDPDDPDVELRAVYQWLTAVQDAVVVELMG
jgi:hypothetical protein